MSYDPPHAYQNTQSSRTRTHTTGRAGVRRRAGRGKCVPVGALPVAGDTWWPGRRGRLWRHRPAGLLLRHAPGRPAQWNAVCADRAGRRPAGRRQSSERRRPGGCAAVCRVIQGTAACCGDRRRVRRGETVVGCELL